MDNTDDKTVVHFNEERGLLEVECSSDLVSRILDFLRAEAKSNDSPPEIPSGGVTQIYIADLFRERTVPAANWKDRVALWGCGLTAFVVIFVFVIGLVAIAGLIPLLH